MILLRCGINDGRCRFGPSVSGFLYALQQTTLFKLWEAPLLTGNLHKILANLLQLKLKKEGHFAIMISEPAWCSCCLEINTSLSHYKNSRHEVLVYISFIYCCLFSAKRHGNQKLRRKNKVNISNKTRWTNGI